MNTGALQGMKCPSCESEGPFRIACSSLATVADTGVTDVADFEWDGPKRCECVACDHAATVDEFTIPDAEPLSNPNEVDDIAEVTA